jgi:hypothetical protein
MRCRHNLLHGSHPIAVHKQVLCIRSFARIANGGMQQSHSGISFHGNAIAFPPGAPPSCGGQERTVTPVRADRGHHSGLFVYCRSARDAIDGFGVRWSLKAARWKARRVLAKDRQYGSPCAHARERTGSPTDPARRLRSPTPIMAALRRLVRSANLANQGAGYLVPSIPKNWLCCAIPLAVFTSVSRFAFLQVPTSPPPHLQYRKNGPASSFERPSNLKGRTARLTNASCSRSRSTRSRTLVMELQSFCSWWPSASAR